MALDAAPLVESLTEDELEMTVEQYLKAQCSRRVDALKRHMESLIDGFHVEAKRAKQTLTDAAVRADTADGTEDDGAEGGEDGLDDAFALVAIRGIHAGRVIRIQPTADQKLWPIGRLDECVVSLAGDDEVSSHHAQISFERKQFKLMDLGSTNGTHVTNDKNSTFKLKKKKNHILKVDHLVTLGSTTFKWCFFADAARIAEQLKALPGGK